MAAQASTLLAQPAAPAHLQLIRAAAADELKQLGGAGRGAALAADLVLAVPARHSSPPGQVVRHCTQLTSPLAPSLLPSTPATTSLWLPARPTSPPDCGVHLVQKVLAHALLLKAAHFSQLLKQLPAGRQAMHGVVSTGADRRGPDTMPMCMRHAAAWTADQTRPSHPSGAAPGPQEARQCPLPVALLLQQHAARHPQRVGLRLQLRAGHGRRCGHAPTEGR